MKRLAIFDIDGTLTDTNAVDDESYMRAIADVLNLDAYRLDWSEAPHITDSALLQARGDRRHRLLPAGATTVLEDLADEHALHAALMSAGHL